MATFVYVDETGSKGTGAQSQPQLILVAALVEESHVQALRDALDNVAMTHLGWVPADFEFHGHEIWGAMKHWAGMGPPALLAAYEDAIGMLDQLDIKIAHSTINKQKLHEKYAGALDDRAYRLALQFLLEKVDRSGPALKIVVADESKSDQLEAINMLANMQEWGSGEVLGIKLRTVIDSLHFVRSHDSPGVQIADLVAYLIQRRRRGPERHPDAQSAVSRMMEIIHSQTPTFREPWPR